MIKPAASIGRISWRAARRNLKIGTQLDSDAARILPRAQWVRILMYAITLVLSTVVCQLRRFVKIEFFNVSVSIQCRLVIISLASKATSHYQVWKFAVNDNCSWLRIKRRACSVLGFFAGGWNITITVHSWFAYRRLFAEHQSSASGVTSVRRQPFRLTANTKQTIIKCCRMDICTTGLPWSGVTGLRDVTEKWFCVDCVRRIGLPNVVLAR